MQKYNEIKLFKKHCHFKIIGLKLKPALGKIGLKKNNSLKSRL